MTTALTFSDAEYVDVYLNGLLAKGDYTAASNTISGLAALASGDIVGFHDIFEVATPCQQRMAARSLVTGCRD